MVSIARHAKISVQDTTTISKYILARVKQLGVKDVFGVPGDFNLHHLDNIEQDPDLNWRGNTNELNGAYAADGYARIVGASFFVSTCGVGELSALNGLAGSYAEQIPVIHLVGTPSTKATASGRILHHTLGPGHLPNCFPDIAKNVTCAQVNVSSKTTAQDIDRAIETCIRRNQPIYISLPQDLVNLVVDASSLGVALNFSQKPNYIAMEEIVVDHITKLLQQAKNPVVIFDAGASRDHIAAECEQLIDALPNVPYFVSSMGKGSVNEHRKNFAGCYAGNLSLASISRSFESADLVLFVGHLATDMNTGMFSFDTDHQKVIELHAEYTLVRGGRFEPCGMKNMLPNLISALKKVQVSSQAEIPRDLALPEPQMSRSAIGPVSYPFFWSTVQKWLREGDCIFAEPGTCGFGITDLKLPKNATVGVQYLWASIGFGTAAMCGGAMALKSLNDGRRCVGFLGDGSYQMSFAEVSNLIRFDLDATIFLINNNGYTVEKYLHGVKARYNSINTAWRYTETLQFFGGDKELCWTVDTEEQLVQLMQDPKFLRDKGVKFVEVKVAEFDAGRLLTQVCKASGRWDEVSQLPVDFDENGKAYA